MKGDRYCFARDDSGHWYLIPLARKNLFDNLVTMEEYDTLEKVFEKNRLEKDVSLYSFVDAR